MKYLIFRRNLNTLMLVFLLLLCSIASAKSNAKGIEIHGQIKNFKEHVVQIVFKWEFDGKYYKDSCVVENSEYLFRTDLLEPTMFSLQVQYRSKDGKMFYKKVDGCTLVYTFFLEPKKVKLISDGSFEKTICLASEANRVLEAYRKGLKSSSAFKSKVDTIYNSLKFPVVDSDDVKGKIADSLSFIEDVENFKQYATTTLGTYLLSSLYNRGYSISELKKLYSLLSDESKLTNSAKLLLKKLNEFTSVVLGQRFEYHTMADTSGNPINLSNIEYKIMLIDFWASWCAPCRKQTKELKQIYSDFHDKGLEVAAVSLDDKLVSWKKAICEDQLTWVNISDLKGWNNELIVKYYVQSIPYNILINDTGEIIGINISMKDLIEKCNNLVHRR